MQKILIIQTAFLGDVILATPLIENLNRQFPNAMIDMMVKKGNEDLLQKHPILRKTLTFDKKQKWTSILQNLREIRIEKYDLVINLQRFASSGFITLLSGSKEKRGFQENPFSWCYSLKFTHDMKQGQHEVDRNLQMISKEVHHPVRKPQLYPSIEDITFVSHFKSTPIFALLLRVYGLQRRLLKRYG
jgi:ADP-heptose:LPS heptosyltransferase